jgi:hypothetical protein
VFLDSLSSSPRCFPGFAFLLPSFMAAVLGPAVPPAIQEIGISCKIHSDSTQPGLRITYHFQKRLSSALKGHMNHQNYHRKYSRRPQTVNWDWSLDLHHRLRPVRLLLGCCYCCCLVSDVEVQVRQQYVVLAWDFPALTQFGHRPLHRSELVFLHCCCFY